MTFAEQYEKALTVRPASPQDTVPEPQYFAGEYYELLEAAAGHIPTVLCGGSMELFTPCTLEYTPLDCRMLLYTKEGAGTLRIHGTDHSLPASSLLYLNCQETSFRLKPVQFPWGITCFSFGGGAF